MKELSTYGRNRGKFFRLFQRCHRPEDREEEAISDRRNIIGDDLRYNTKIQ